MFLDNECCNRSPKVREELQVAVDQLPPAGFETRRIFGSRGELDH